MLNGAENEVKARGYRIVFCSTDDNQEEIAVLKHLQEENVAGVLLWPNPDLTLTKEQNIRNYGQIRIPIVLMDRAIHGGEYDCVTSDNYNGIATLMQHLIDLGHERIVFLSHPATAITPIMERYRAYEEVMTDAGLKPQPIWIVGEEQKEINAAQVLRACIDSSSPKLRQIIAQIENTHPRPTAIVAVNDFVAIIAMRAIKVMHLSVPDDIAVAGFDDTDLSVYLEVPLTTVAQDTFAIGKRAAQILLERIDGRDGAMISEYIPTELRVRTSTAVTTTVERG
jgi:DNA-binding LacI/PurR family transcriptional regulator